jgi:hypothetical protein
MNRWLRDTVSLASKIATSAQRRIVSPGGPTDYGVLFALTIIPIGLSYLFGMARTLELTMLTSKGPITALCAGYWDRWNWMSYPILLPAALFAVRACCDRLFRLTERTSSSPAIPDLTENKDYESFRGVLFDYRNLLVTMMIVLVIHVIDMKGVVYYFRKALIRNWKPEGLPTPIWDWTAWFLKDLDSRSLLLKNAALVVFAYILQFIIVTLAFTLITAILRHNVFYLGRIYLRSRGGTNDPRSFIVLNFEDGNGRFGMDGLGTRFNVQIRFLAFAGCFTLLSRMSNAQTALFLAFVEQIRFTQILEPTKLLADFPSNLAPLFPDSGQPIFALSWILMFFIVFLPARVKLLPLQRGRRGAKEYLAEFIPPGSEFEIQHNMLAKKKDVDEVAGLFRDQSFWPVGDTYAKFLSVWAFVVFFLILVPIAPSSPQVLLFYLFVIVLAYLSSRLLFWYFRYRLYSVDERLVKKPEKD